jgi:hypothetical protein
MMSSDEEMGMTRADEDLQDRNHHEDESDSPKQEAD